MSYILDALRRADAERERGAVPGLQSAASPAADDGDPGRGTSAGRWPIAAGVAAGVVLIGAFGWWLGAGSAKPEPRAEAVAPPAMPAPLPAPVPTAAAPAAQVAAPPTPAFLPPPPVRDVVREVAAPPRAASAVAAPVASAAAPAVPASAAAPARLPTRDELPDELRRTLPPLAVGGLMYSENADKRMVILDGRLLREGDALGNGLVLEQIRPRSAVFSVPGARFELKF